MTILDQAAKLYSRGQLERALQVATGGLAAEKRNAGPLCDIAAASAQGLGNLPLAEQFWRLAVVHRPDAAESHYNLGSFLAGTGRLQDAEASFARAVALAPGFADAHFSLGRCLADRGLGSEAEPSIRKALELEPARAAAHFYLGLVRFKAGDMAAAERSYRRAIELDPTMAEAYNNLGDLLAKSGQQAEAERCYRQAISVAPDFADAKYNLGNLLADAGRGGEAEACFRDVIASHPGFARAHLNLGVLLEKRGREEDAEACFRQALARDPGFAEAHVDLGGLLFRAGRLEEAERCANRAIELGRDLPDAHVLLGNVCMATARYAQAEAPYRRALALDAGHADLLTTVIHCANYSGDWTRFDEDIRRLRAHLGRAGSRYVEVPSLLSIPGFTALEQKELSAKYATERWRADAMGAPLVASGAGRNHERLRIGYLSANFYRHAVGEVLAGVLEAHDPGRIEVYGYSYGPDIDDEARRRIRSACPVFRDLRTLGDEAAARAIAGDEIDILVDLVGYTEGCRPGICARRPAPLIASWLGYPGTLGHRRLADVIIGDPTVTPPEHAAHFSERLALMPHCYLPYDRNRTVGPRPDCGALGLPEGAFIFCSFNQNYKINPEIFDVWCRVLREVPDSVLWQQWRNDAAVANFRREAADRGIAPGRLVFTERVPSVADHLGRLQVADLALDSFPYTSHSTGSDALWAGVPLVSRIGETFASRVSASILHAAGLPELVVDDWDGYVALAKRLALDQSGLERIRGKLAGGRQAAPLFDTTRFARDIEELFEMIWKEHGTGATAGVIRSSSGEARA